MDSETARRLCCITSEFYREHSDSFSATRHAPWAGWERCLEAIGTEAFERKDGEDLDSKGNWVFDDKDGGGFGSTGGEAFGRSGDEAVSVFDLACGNLRFESFLESAFPAVDFEFYAVDKCDALAFGGAETTLRSSLRYRSIDILSALSAGKIDVPVCDLAVAFGFMHHVPGALDRGRVLAELVSHTRPGGFAAVSFWRFLNDEGLAEKARASHARARDELGLPELDEGDYLLGWRNEPGAYRYCHSFSDAEIDELAGSVADRASVVARFSADGRTGDLNTYVVFRAR
ncbi:class I SAM-dependent methyltransferase [Raoultibacter phocaeensis]|uniref:class I SAM-dependent methyltransferase n=1 Tax=Raoultibacter phocaeensis TaxID=2479841 RepID=UPI00111A7297|nr:class I SAM-dependent methyltransferase [Raoultibacter phocaeensis]